MPPEPDRVELSPETRQTYAEVQRDYEVKLWSSGVLTFTCVRCQLVFDRDDFAQVSELVNALRGHAAHHGPPSAQARAYRAAKIARRRARGDVVPSVQGRLVFESLPD